MALRIKDNVNLKELEMFGIRKGYRLPILISKNTEYEVMSIDEDRLINIGRNLWWSMEYYYGYVTNESHKSGEDILFDLIEAGLVEKVVD